MGGQRTSPESRKLKLAACWMPKIRSRFPGAGDCITYMHTLHHSGDVGSPGDQPYFIWPAPTWSTSTTSDSSRYIEVIGLYLTTDKVTIYICYYTID